ncbi:MAG: PAC2 family protein, partial [Candidatus Heimdallarchaeota archaeon]
KGLNRMVKWTKIFLQGLVGQGLVGYNTVKTMIDGLEAKSIKDYGEYFPNLSLIDNGKIENQCVRVFEVKKNENNFLIMNGPQPRSDEISSLFLQKVIGDIDEMNEQNKIDVYLSFGAYVTKNLSPYEIETDKKLPASELADLVLKHELEKERKLYIATSGFDFDKFTKILGIPEQEVVKESQGFISGLNGVLPAMIGERLNIPTATIMIETTGTESSRSANFPALAQYLGFLSTKRALQFLNKTFNFDLDIETRITKVLDEIKDSAKEEIISYIEKDFQEDKRDTETDHRAMYV